MILAIDVGNSSISLGAFSDAGELCFVSGFETELGRSRDRCAVDIKNIFELYGCDVRQVRGVVISSVVPPVTPNIAAAARLLTGKDPVVVGPGVRSGVNIRTEVHTQLGSDIVAAAVGALEQYKPPLIIIDMGTATTVTAVNGDGALLGCAIFPGVRVALESLSQHTAQLPRISIEAPRHVIGRNTVDSMRSGIVYGTAGMLDGLIERISEEIGPATVLTTGGNVNGISEYCRHEMIHDADLVLRGLYTIFVRNADKPAKL